MNIVLFIILFLVGYVLGAILGIRESMLLIHINRARTHIKEIKKFKYEDACKLAFQHKVENQK